MKSEAFPTGCHKSISLQKEKYWTADEVSTKTSKFICISETKKKKKKKRLFPLPPGDNTSFTKDMLGGELAVLACEKWTNSL